METVNGRILPDDSNSSEPDHPPVAPPASLGSDSDCQTQNSKRSQPHRRSREAELPESECTIGSADPSRDGGPAFSQTSDSHARSESSRYVELDELGRGGWGIVQRALDRQLQREVAVKRINTPGEIHDAGREQFLHEARITSGLQHPGVVPVHELVDERGGDTYYVMKLLEGDTLRHHIRRSHADCSDGNWTRHNLVTAITPLLLRFIDVCNAVAYAHRCGIIHRDLKPTNVMAGAFGETIVVDWGLARYIGDETEETTLQGPSTPGESSGSHRSSAPPESEGSVIGTPTYMAPEQARGELDSLGSHSDIYSLGVILYEIVAGHHPHKGMSVKTVLRRARTGEYDALSKTQPCVPKALDRIVQTAMSADAVERYRDVEALANDVKRFMTGERVSVHQESLVERSVRWCGRHKSIATTVAVAGTLLLAVSICSTVVIQKAHREERAARIAAKEAHHEALVRLVDARDTADTWLVDLSGSLQFYPAMKPLRQELLTQALAQYEKLLDPPIEAIPTTSLTDTTESSIERDERKTITLVWLERAKCHLRLGDLNRLSGSDDASLKHYRTADNILAKLQRSAAPIRLVSTTRSIRNSDLASDWHLHRPDLAELLILERINAAIGKSLVSTQSPSPADALQFREQLRQWLPWEPDSASTRVPDAFVSRVVSALVRLELVIQRTNPPDAQSGRRLFSNERFSNAVLWAQWLAHQRGQASDFKLLETIATESAERYARDGTFLNAFDGWTLLITELNLRFETHGKRIDWMQSLAHAKIRRAEVAAKLGNVSKAADDYCDAIANLEQTWALSDDDDFFRVNLATAENNLARIWMRGDNDQQSKAERLFAQSIATYQALLRESATPDLMRRLAQTHSAMAECIALRSTPDRKTESHDQLKHLDSERLAYQILSDQNFASDEDRLAWAQCIWKIGCLDTTKANDERIDQLLDSIDTNSLSQSGRQTFEDLRDRQSNRDQ